MQKDALLQGIGTSVAVQTETTKISDGLGYGDGSISAAALHDQLGDVYGIVSHAVETAILSPEVLVPVSKGDDGHMITDDGCGDGRPVGTIFTKTQHFKRSLHRPKVFGGGIAMSLAGLIGQGKTAGQTLNQAFVVALGVLKDNMIDFGAHTDDHAQAPNAGCGAIDKAPLVVENAVKYQKQIRETIAALGEDMTGLDDIEAQYHAYAQEIHGQQGYSGKLVIDEIVDSGKIVKQLTGPHIEIAVVLNTVKNFTVDQGAIRQAAEGRADVFAVDVWRMKKLAESMYHDLREQHVAYLSGLVYTLATAATLTKGDLPVYVVQLKPQRVRVPVAA